MPTPRFNTGVIKTPPARQFVQTAGTDSFVTTEPVQVSGSQTAIRGIQTPTRVQMSLKDGDLVDVLWEKGKPKIILAMRGQHGAGTDEFFGGTLLEELFVIRRPDDDVKDVYFRDASQCSPLHLDDLGVETEDINLLSFGGCPANNRFMVNVRASHFDVGLGQFVVTLNKTYVIKMERSPNTAFKAGALVRNLVTIESTVDFLTDTTPVATIFPIGSPSSATLTPANPTATIPSGSSHRAPWDVGLGADSAGFALDHRGHIIASYVIQVSGAVLPKDVEAGSEIANNQLFLLSGGGSNFNTHFVLVNLRYPVVIDLMTGFKLLDGLSGDSIGDIMSPIAAGSTLNINTFDWTGGYPGEWVLLDSAITADPDTSWQFISFHPSVSELQNYDVFGFFASWKFPDHQSLLRGYLGWARVESTNDTHYQNDGPTSDFPTFGSTGSTATDFPGPVTGQRRSSMCSSPKAGLHTQLSDEGSGSLRNGFVLGGWTYNHLVWQTDGHGEFRPGDGIQAFDDRLTSFITNMDTGVTTEMSVAFSGKVALGADTGNNPYLKIIGSDFVYRLDGVSPPPPVLAAGTPTNYFVPMWKFKGAVTITPAQIASAPNWPQDHQMKALAKLFPLSEEIVAALAAEQTSDNVVILDLQLVNSSSTLGAIGKYEAL